MMPPLEASHPGVRDIRIIKSSKHHFENHLIQNNPISKNRRDLNCLSYSKSASLLNAYQ